MPVKDGSGGRYGPWETDFWKLFVYDLTTSKTLCLDYRANGSVIAWSEKEDEVYIRCPPIQYPDIPGIRGVAKFVIVQDHIEVEPIVDPKTLAFSCTYGRFGHRSYARGKVYIRRFSDSFGELKAVTPTHPHPSVGSYISITRDKEVLFSFSNSPFYAPLSMGWIYKPSIIQEGKECLFENGTQLYLIDIAEKKIGKLTHGVDHLVLTKSYQQGFHFMKD